MIHDDLDDLFRPTANLIYDVIGSKKKWRAWSLLRTWNGMEFDSSSAAFDSKVDAAKLARRAQQACGGILSERAKAILRNAALLARHKR